MTPADIRQLELMAKRGDARAAMKLNALYSQATGGAGAAIIDPSKSEQIPPEHQVPFPCECGGEVFEDTPLFRFVKDGRDGDKPKKIAIAPLRMHKCLRCGRYVSLAKKSAAGPMLEGAEDHLLLQVADLAGSLEQVVDRAVRGVLGTVGHILDTALGDEKRADEIMKLILTNLGYQTTEEAPVPTAEAKT
jgi:hypothetical protein